jgi:hypothetical protein
MSNGIFKLLAIRLGSINIGPSLTHAANGCFKATISRGPVAVFGRERSSLCIGSMHF